MLFPAFYLALSALILVSALFVVRRRDPSLRGFSVASSLTLVVLLAAALLRLDRGAPEPHFWMGVVTVANLSAASVLLVVWTVRLRRG